MYALVYVEPRSGVVFEVHAPRVTAAYAARFAPLEADARACAGAITLPFAPDELERWWSALSAGGRDNVTGADAGGSLPSALLAKISTPVAGVASAGVFNEAWAALPWRRPRTRSARRAAAARAAPRAAAPASTPRRC